MSLYESSVREKSAEEILEQISKSIEDPSLQDIREYMLVAARVRVAQRQIAVQVNATEHLVSTTTSMIAAQHKAAGELVNSIGKLTAGIERASDDSGKLGKRVVVLTFALVAVGLLQAVAMAWPYIDYWMHH
jgi:hypothetical protein